MQEEMVVDREATDRKGASGQFYLDAAGRESHLDDGDVFDGLASSSCIL